MISRGDRSSVRFAIVLLAIPVLPPLPLLVVTLVGILVSAASIYGPAGVGLDGRVVSSR